MMEIGVDLVSVRRMARFLERFGARGVDRLFTPAERRLCEGRRDVARCFAARFAAKEALLKALGTGLRGVRWTDISVETEGKGQPVYRLHPRVQALLRNRIPKVSLSHEKEYALAVCVLVGNAGDRPGRERPPEKG